MAKRLTFNFFNSRKRSKKIPATKIENPFIHDWLKGDIADYARETDEPWTLLRLLEDIAQRASELNDPVLNALILRIGMYDIKEDMICECLNDCKKKYDESFLIFKKLQEN